MGDGEDGTGVGLQVALEPTGPASASQVVGGLVEEQQVGLLRETLAQRDAAALTTGEVVDEGRRAGKRRGVHRLLGRLSRSQALMLSGSVCGSPVSAIRASGRRQGRPSPCRRPRARNLRLTSATASSDVLQRRLALGQRRLLLEHADRRGRARCRRCWAGQARPSRAGTTCPCRSARRHRSWRRAGTTASRCRDDLVAVGLADVAQERTYSAMPPRLPALTASPWSGSPAAPLPDAGVPLTKLAVRG